VKEKEGGRTSIQDGILTSQQADNRKVTVVAGVDHRDENPNPKLMTTIIAQAEEKVETQANLDCI
jgi:hypothetical protein